MPAPKEIHAERFSISLEPDLLEAFDAFRAQRGYATRSEAVRDLIREALVQRAWEQPDTEVVGTLTLVYDHDATDVSNALTNLQHHHHSAVVCTTHVHLDERDCLEVTVLRGSSAEVRRLADHLLAHKGVVHGRLVTTAARGGLPAR
ncbi:MAG TPA: nickel-responsive transcriptional regulator NikR [Armatimonadota bacterium]|jgi:CopG family nickel-responsive transcriptional regulator